MIFRFSNDRFLTCDRKSEKSFLKTNFKWKSVNRKNWYKWQVRWCKSARALFEKFLHHPKKLKKGTLEEGRTIRIFPFDCLKKTLEVFWLCCTTWKNRNLPPLKIGILIKIVLPPKCVILWFFLSFLMNFLKWTWYIFWLYKVSLLEIFRITKRYNKKISVCERIIYLTTGKWLILVTKAKILNYILPSVMIFKEGYFAKPK